jgi:L-methionine (R)-S-oxide reductase
MENDDDWKSRLEQILAEFDCQTGTIHQSAGDGTMLALICQIGVPETLWDKISLIPVGKGIAGAAAERREAVKLCNLQQDLGGVAKPDARQTGVSGSLAVPIFSQDGGQVVGTLGIGKFSAYDFSPDEEDRLAAHARELSGLFANKAGCGD